MTRASLEDWTTRRGMGTVAEGPRESDVLTAVLAALRVHPKVWRVWRSNSGVAQYDSRYVKFGLRGQCDITGMLRDGRRLEVEVKRNSGKLTDDQVAFVQMIRQGGGVAFTARCVDDVVTYLGPFGDGR